MNTLVLSALLIGGLALAGPLRAQQSAPASAPPDPFTQVLTAETLREHGIFRLNDALDLLDGWQTATTDGYAATMSAGALGPLDSEVLVLVDGHPVDTNLLGTSNLNTLPLHISEIARIEAIAVPTLVGGVFAPAGVLRITTRSPERGVRAAVGLGVANETSDPGPFRYTNDATPNIDRLGPNLWAAGSLAGASASVTATAYSDQHHATDERVHERVRLLYTSALPARFGARGAGARGRLSGRYGTMQATASLSTHDDFRLLAGTLAGGEIPLRFDVIQTGLSGDTAPGARTGLAYRLAYTRLATDSIGNPEHIDLGWREDRVRAHLTARTQIAGLGVALGAGLDRTRAESAGPLDRPVRTLGRVDLALSGAAGGWGGRFVSAAVIARRRAGTKLLATLTRRLDAATVLTLHMNYTRRLPEERRDRGSWSTGAAFPRFIWTESYSPLDDLISEAITADIALSGTLATRLRYTATVRYRYASTQQGVIATHTTRPEDPGVDIGYGLGGGRGTTLGGEGLLAWTPRTGLSHRLHYAYTRPISDPDASNIIPSRFAMTWGALARHRITYAARLAPSDRFALRLRARWTSASRWQQHRGIAERSGGLYDERLPPRLIVDVSASKRLWGPHLSGFVGLRNALDAEDRTHPIGPIDRLSLYLTLQVQL